MTNIIYNAFHASPVRSNSFVRPSYYIVFLVLYTSNIRHVFVLSQIEEYVAELVTCRPRAHSLWAYWLTRTCPITVALLMRDSAHIHNTVTFSMQQRLRRTYLHMTTGFDESVNNILTDWAKRSSQAWANFRFDFVIVKFHIRSPSLRRVASRHWTGIESCKCKVMWFRISPVRQLTPI